MTDVRLAIESARDFPGVRALLQCHVDDVFAAARLGVPISCEVRQEGDSDPEPATGTLRIVAGGNTLTGDLARWRKYQPGEPGSEGPFAGHYVPWGQVGVEADRQFYLSWPASGYHSVDSPNCIGTTVYGKDSGGTAWTVNLSVVRI